MKVIYLNAVKFLVLLSLLILSSCGMQGDLYLPEKNTTDPVKEINKGS